jgi:hypothetical protein
MTIARSITELNSAMLAQPKKLGYPTVKVQSLARVQGKFRKSLDLVHCQSPTLCYLPGGIKRVPALPTRLTALLECVQYYSMPPFAILLSLS